MLVRALLLSLCFCVSATAQQNAEWRQPFPPFKLIGNVYWVGTYDLSTYLITTDAGHILINTGFEDTVPLIVVSGWPIDAQSTWKHCRPSHVGSSATHVPSSAQWRPGPHSVPPGVHTPSSSPPPLLPPQATSVPRTIDPRNERHIEKRWPQCIADLPAEMLSIQRASNRDATSVADGVTSTLIESWCPLRLQTITRLFRARLTLGDGQRLSDRYPRAASARLRISAIVAA
jgi:hypothetical protein